MARDYRSGPLGTHQTSRSTNPRNWWRCVASSSRPSGSRWSRKCRGCKRGRPDDLAYILYTSGSSGIPKGVMTTQRNATSYVDWCSGLFGASQEDRFGNHAPFHFAMSIVDIFLPIKHGGSVHLVPEDLGKNPRELASFIGKQRLTVWYSTPAIDR